MSVRDFPPVFLPDGALDGRYSVTFGRAENQCPRSAFLYVKYSGGAAAHPLERGSALHRVFEVATRTLLDENAGQERPEPIPAEVVKVIVNEVLADPHYRCPFEEHDYLREAAYRWADEVRTLFDPRRIVAVETLMVLEVGGWQIRAKIDYAELLGAVLRLWDYKSSRSMPTQEDVGRKRPDGSIAAKDYQLVLYALACVFGRPVRVEPCPFCVSMPCAACTSCGGKGRIETVEPFPVAGTAQHVDLAYVFPGIEDKHTGGMAKREMSLTRLELAEYMASIEAQVAHVKYRKRTGDWPAVRGSHCVECPAKLECPIPAVLRDFAGTINTPEQAAEAAEQLDAEKSWHTARWKELVNYVKTLPGQRLRFGRDLVIEPVLRSSSEIRDKDAMFDAVERARLYGEPFERSRFVKQKMSTAPAQRRLSEQELAEERAEGSNEEEAA